MGLKTVKPTCFTFCQKRLHIHEVGGGGEKETRLMTCVHGPVRHLKLANGESDTGKRRMATAPQGWTPDHLHPHYVPLLEVNRDHVGPGVQGLAACRYPQQPPASRVDVHFYPDARCLATVVHHLHINVNHLNTATCDRIHCALHETCKDEKKKPRMI